MHDLDSAIKSTISKLLALPFSYIYIYIYIYIVLSKVNGTLSDPRTKI